MITEKAYHVALSYSCVLPRTLRLLLGRFGSAKAVWDARDNAIQQECGSTFLRFRQEFSVEDHWKQLNRSGINAITLDEADYPASLKEITDPPIVLYHKGSALPGKAPALAIVGARAATPAGKLRAGKLAEGLVACGFSIVSGLALGIDMSAHWGALEGGGETFAVLGSGLDKIYPYQNENLAKQIEKQGGLLSEFPPGTPPLQWNFPRRNRIISALSAGVIVVEAGEKSGALITARYALEQGREVFAIPGDPERPMSMGTNSLIQGGAKLINKIEDILEEFPYLPAIKKEGDIILGHRLGLEQKIINTLSSAKDGVLINQLIKETDTSVHQLMGTLLLLETRGMVSRLPGNVYVRT